MQGSPYAQWARQFLDLWQRQMAATMNDGEFLRAMTDMLHAADPSAARYDAHTAHSADASVSSRALLERLDGIEHRLRELEQRVGQLSRRAAKPKSKP